METNMAARRDKILDLIVRSYIEDAEPVGSRTISRKSTVGLSPASIRNIMADLEDQELICQPHTSAGRVPTDKGYRYWIDCLMEPEELTEPEKDWVRQELGKIRTIEGLAHRVSKIISKLTGNAGLIYIKNLKRVSFLNHILEELIAAQRLADYLEEEPELFLDGASLIFEQPEFRDIAKMRTLMHAFDEKVYFIQAFVHGLEEPMVHVRIGSENQIDDLENVSLVVKDCFLGDVVIGGVAVVGPTRMKYPKAVSAVNFVADTVSESVQRF
jgi:heat-inducible transcriptional repressor